MGMATTDLPICTIEELLSLPEDGFRHELLRGEHVVTPAPRVRHQLVVEDLAEHLRRFVATQVGVRCFSSLVDVHVDSTTLLQPDICVFNLASGIPDDWCDFPLPRLVVEVLSPGTADRDRGQKKEIYQAAGVPEYWIVDIDSRLVERWRPEDQRPEILRETITWQPADAEKGVVIDLVQLFSQSKTD